MFEYTYTAKTLTKKTLTQAEVPGQLCSHIHWEAKHNAWRWCPHRGQHWAQSHQQSCCPGTFIIPHWHHMTPSPIASQLLAGWNTNMHLKIQSMISSLLTTRTEHTELHCKGANRSSNTKLFQLWTLKLWTLRQVCPLLVIQAPEQSHCLSGWFQCRRGGQLPTSKQRSSLGSSLPVFQETSGGTNADTPVDTTHAKVFSPHATAQASTSAHLLLKNCGILCQDDLLITFWILRLWKHSSKSRQLLKCKVFETVNPLPACPQKLSQNHLWQNCVCSPFFSVKIYCLEYPQRGQPHRLVKVVSVNTVHGCPWNRRSLLTKFGGPKNMDQLIKAPNYPILCYHGTTSSNWFLFANWLSPEHSKFPASCIPKTPACTQLIDHKNNVFIYLFIYLFIFIYLFVYFFIYIYI